MPSNSAAYMREYRARKRAVRTVDEILAPRRDGKITEDRLQERIDELEAEVHRLKGELAKRPAVIAPGFNTAPFSPAPKPSQRK